MSKIMWTGPLVVESELPSPYHRSGMYTVDIVILPKQTSIFKLFNLMVVFSE